MFIAENATIRAYDLSITYDVSSAVSAETYETTYGVITGLVFNFDGSRIFTTAQDNDSVNEYAMPTAYKDEPHALAARKPPSPPLCHQDENFRAAARASAIATI